MYRDIEKRVHALESKAPTRKPPSQTTDTFGQTLNKLEKAPPETLRQLIAELGTNNETDNQIMQAFAETSGFSVQQLNELTNQTLSLQLEALLTQAVGGEGV